MDKEEKKPISKQYKYLGIITALYITFQLVSTVTAGKIVQVWIFSTSIAVLYFPVTFIISDILTEVYGYARARRILWTILLTSIVAGIIFAIAAAFPPASGFDANDAYVRVLGQIPRILVASWLALFFGGISNDYVLAKMKVLTKGKHLWARTIGSTLVGQAVDSIIFFTVALYGVIPTNLLLMSMFTAWFLKVMIEAILTPVTYKVVNSLKKAEGEDHYDIDTNFNPFSFKVKN